LNKNKDSNWFFLSVLFIDVGFMLPAVTITSHRRENVEGKREKEIEIQAEE
jgi:hypothetical protein